MDSHLRNVVRELCSVQFHGHLPIGQCQHSDQVLPLPIEPQASIQLLHTFNGMDC